uniref:Glycosyltransferase 2-like domain-containing protein n=1 Tax=uncultured Elusimicrobia bacterium TaxID=699876 RepID=A0A650EMI4_9BACT|nr:hypothetical protein Elusimicrob2101_1260 [uncultured Elusimicrobia bacterium]
MSPAISVLIPVYNAEKYLEACLNSLSNQTFTDFEIICLDDGSQDSSAKVMQAVARREPRLRIVTQSNAGVAVTRNRLLAEARGAYAAFVDADDWVEPDYLQSLYKEARRTGADITKCFFKEFDVTAGVFQKACCASRFYQMPGSSAAEKFLCGYYDSVVWGKLWRLDFLRKHKLSFLPGQVAEDLAFVTQGFCLADKITLVQKELYIYRKGVNGAITSSPENMAVGILRNLIHLRQVLEERRIWCAQIADKWVFTVVWGVCRFRKFPVADRAKHAELLRAAWCAAERSSFQCAGGSRLRWRLLMGLVRLCGWKSVFFWTKLFR